MGDPTLLAAEEVDLFAVLVEVLDVVLAVAVEHEELAVVFVQRPGRAVLLRAVVLTGVLRPAPSLQHFAVERCLDDLAQTDVGDVEDLALVFTFTLGLDRQAMGTGKVECPGTVEAAAIAVVDDDVVLDMVGQQDESPVCRLDNPVTVLDNRFVLFEHAPVLVDTVFEVAMTKDRTLSAGLATHDDGGEERSRRGRGR